MIKPKVTGATIPYQLRPHKAIERNLFIKILKLLDASSIVDIKEYRYVGFGAAFLEDFKLLHLEVNIVDMECIETDFCAYSRQEFNKPFSFLKIHNLKSTEYISTDYKQDKNQIIWLDYATPKELKQQLIDIELLTEKVNSLDILKFTFNAELRSLPISTSAKKKNKDDGMVDYSQVLNGLSEDSTFQLYIPDNIKIRDLTSIEGISSIIRAMAVRAINRGLSKAGSNMNFYHIASFSYADGQEMTTMTGIVATETEFEQILEESKLLSWEFYQGGPVVGEFINASEISVPAMTVSERIEIDRKFPISDAESLAKSISFFYGTTDDENLQLLDGYRKFYKYLPYYTKVMY